MLHFIKHSSQLHVLVLVVAVLIFIYSKQSNNQGTNDGETKTSRDDSSEIILTKEQLKLYDGSEGSLGLYIGIMGSIFDVKRGTKHYGPGGSYQFFAGKDATSAFISGKFETDTGDLDDLSEMNPKQILGVFNWKNFYDKDYTYIGKVIGKFYDESGRSTQYHKEVLNQVEVAKREQDLEEKLKTEFPPCNTEWKAETGSLFWCTDKSGGIERDYVGVPRKQYKPGQTDFNCVCVSEDKLKHPSLKEFENCDPTSIKCTFVLDDENIK